MQSIKKEKKGHHLKKKKDTTIKKGGDCISLALPYQPRRLCCAYMTQTLVHAQNYR